MSSKSVSVYFLTIKIVPQKEGLNLPQLIRKISNLLKDKDPDIKFLHKVKVTGEATILVFVQVTNNAELESVTANIFALGSIDIESRPVVFYEHFAENLKAASDLCCKKNESCLQREGLYFLEFSVEYHGFKFDEFIACWKKEAEAVLSLRHKGDLRIELFKGLTERTVQALINSPEPAKLDFSIMSLPIMIDNGNNILLKSKAIQYLDDYNNLKFN